MRFPLMIFYSCLLKKTLHDALHACTPCLLFSVHLCLFTNVDSCMHTPPSPTLLLLMTCFLQRWKDSLPCSKSLQQRCSVHLQEAGISFRTMTCYWAQVEGTSDFSWPGKREGKRLGWTRRVFLCHRLIRQTSDIMEKAAKIAEIEGMPPDFCGPALCFSRLRYF